MFLLRKAERLLNQHGIIYVYSPTDCTSRLLMRPRDVRTGRSNGAAQVLTMTFTECFKKETFGETLVFENPGLFN